MSKKKEPLEGDVIKKRKGKYEPWMCDVVEALGESGKDVAHMCVALGIKSRTTFYEWVEKYPEFKDAYEAAKLKSYVHHTDNLEKGMVGELKGFNAKAAEMLLYNKFPDQYKRPNSGSHTEINVGSINSIEKMSDDEVTRLIQEKIQKLELLDNVTESSTARTEKGDSSSS